MQTFSKFYCEHYELILKYKAALEKTKQNNNNNKSSARPIGIRVSLCLTLTHLCLASHKMELANSVNPDQSDRLIMVYTVCI